MESQHSPKSNQLGHEPPGANVRAVLQVGAILAAIVAFAFLLVFGMMEFFAVADGVETRESTSEPLPLPPGTPRLNADQPTELRALRDREELILNSYGWTDRSAGRVRIPIHRAMQIITEKGLASILPTPREPGDPLPEDGTQ